MEAHITLYSDDAEWFRDIKKRIARERGGSEPSNAELVRMLMQDADL